MDKKSAFKFFGLSSTIAVLFFSVFVLFPIENSEAQNRELDINSSGSTRCLYQAAKELVTQYRGQKQASSIRLFCSNGSPVYQWADGGSANFPDRYVKSCGNPCR
jgi:hypothetical protein